MSDLRFTWDPEKARSNEHKHKSSRFRLLVVSHTTEEDGDAVRLISVRKARKKERTQYLERYRR